MLVFENMKQVIYCEAFTKRFSEMFHNTRTKRYELPSAGETEEEAANVWTFKDSCNTNIANFVYLWKT